MNKLEQMQELLAALELALLENGWWGSDAPDDAALASTEPFCVDALTFSEWLQWVYIPKMRAYMAAHGELPERSGLLAIAEEAWRGSAEDTEGLLLVMRALDGLVNNEAAAPQHVQEVCCRYRRH
jgi:tRNA pseudouridine synthase C